ncbi:hypothetical protein BX616_011044 [Lobosporangium transversale]|uniref:PLC-like phosphodiesterase n=1 Tax=Lobosporangium transversale TaxID=64571 RepID=A0A1Y2GKI5_9FUNG|nr:PLC-like phosphodiesterase [Lobosporangium transversale]KAF9909838.1 hypothetical protein BX616_011044 [Lobosporangium transversale]ORZ13457.1 PLC-like phosphodiesterase [Lobosporangium transversale]|eukprot:XP_021880538.1 PLC-like phosphodiesterase [Lobosporangium transversale]
MRSSLVLSVATTLLSASLVQQTHAQQLCNGYAGLCAKTYDQVAYPTTHNAYAYQPADALALNQHNDIPTQLGDGIRAFMLDAYKSTNPNDIQLCHTSCNLLDAGPLSKVLSQIKSFLDDNKNEVITIFWENSADLAASQFQTVYAAAGLSDYLYTQSAGTTKWPTLAEMISSGKRLVNFIASGADASVPWLMNEYDYVFETPYQITKGAEFPCTIDRPSGERKQMYVLNHFISQTLATGGQNIDVPQPDAAAQTNGEDLVTHINSCQSTFSQVPNFVAVDFYEKGTLLQTVAQINDVPFNNKTPTQPKNSGSSGNNGKGKGNGGEVLMSKGADLKAIGVAAMAVVCGYMAF